MAGAGVLPTADFEALPTDLQLVSSYLGRHIREGTEWPYVHACDVYSDMPQNLVRRFRPAVASDGGRCWLFLTRLKPQPGSSTRVMRKVGHGTWQGERSASKIEDGAKVCHGFMYRLTFVVKDPTSRSRRSQGWKMAEYKLAGPRDNATTNNVVLCMIYTTTRTDPVGALPATPDPAVLLSSPSRLSSFTTGAPPHPAAPLSGAQDTLIMPVHPPSQSPHTPLLRPKSAADLSAASDDPSLPQLAPPRPPSPPRAHPDEPSFASKPSLGAPPARGALSPLRSSPATQVQQPHGHLHGLPQDDKEERRHFKHPSDQELVSKYLMPHVAASSFINKADVYRRHPAELTADFAPASLPDEADLLWYFFSLGSRGSSRWVDDESGYWKTQFGVKEIMLGADAIGKRQLFSFLTRQHEPTQWSMVEIALVDGANQTKLYRVCCRNGRKRKRASPEKTSLRGSNMAREPQLGEELDREPGDRGDFDLNKVS